MAKGDDIQERLIRLAVALVRICDQLPETRTGGHVASQLLRSGTSPAPNYAEARGAESDKDFIHKLGIVLKELNESLVWLNIIERSAMLPQEDLTPQGRMHHDVQNHCREHQHSEKEVRHGKTKPRPRPGLIENRGSKIEN